MDQIKGLALSPREYVEHQLNMTEDEKKARQEFFGELFSAHDQWKEQELVNQA